VLVSGLLRFSGVKWFRPPRRSCSSDFSRFDDEGGRRWPEWTGRQEEVLLDDHADVVRESVRWVAAQLMESEVSELLGAELGERRP
jgi:hypothetical protein